MLLSRPGRSLLRRPCEEHGTRSGCTRAGERTPNKSCQIHPAICPALPVLATLLPGAESRVWTTAAHVKSRIHLTPAAFARVSHSCTQHSSPGGHNLGARRLSVKSESRTGYHACCWTTTAHTRTHTPPQPKGRIPPTRPMAADALGSDVKASRGAGGEVTPLSALSRSLR